MVVHSNPLGVLNEERLLDEAYDVALDYKFFVFHSRVAYIQVDSDRQRSMRFRFYSRNWGPLDIRYGSSELAPVIKRPDKLEDMIDIAETLAQEFDFVRVDLYNPNGERILFGEMTFSPAAGRKPFLPRQFDFDLGALW